MLDQNALKLWRYRYWLYPRDPQFVPKACVVLDLETISEDNAAVHGSEYTSVIRREAIHVR